MITVEGIPRYDRYSKYFVPKLVRMLIRFDVTPYPSNSLVDKVLLMQQSPAKKPIDEYPDLYVLGVARFLLLGALWG